MEANTRIQVEHTITEELTGIDLVKEQIKIAQGKKMTIRQKDIQFNSHVFEFRINAEDPANNFLPVTGTILQFIPEESAFGRFDTGVESGSTIDIYYDPMVAKVITYGESRAEAIRKMQTTVYPSRFEFSPGRTAPSRDRARRNGVTPL